MFNVINWEKTQYLCYNNESCSRNSQTGLLNVGHIPYQEGNPGNMRCCHFSKEVIHKKENIP